MYIHIYTYKERDRVRDREREREVCTLVACPRYIDQTYVGSREGGGETA